MHCGIILKDSFSYGAEQIIHQNFIVSIVQIATYLLFVFLSYVDANGSVTLGKSRQIPQGQIVKIGARQQN